MASRGGHSSGNDFTNDTTWSLTVPFSGAVWIYPLTKAWETYWSACKATSDIDYFRMVTAGTAGTARLQVKCGLSTYNVAPGMVMTLNAWNLFRFTVSDSALHPAWAWTNAQKTLSSVNLVNLPTTERAAAGVRYGVIPTHWFSGYLGCMAFWNTNIADASFDRLWDERLDFRRLLPGNLVHYWDFTGTGNVADQIGSYDWTENGTVAEQTTNPLLRRPALRHEELNYMGVPA